MGIIISYYSGFVEKLKTQYTQQAICTKLTYQNRANVLTFLLNDILSSKLPLSRCSSFESDVEAHIQHVIS